MTMRETSLCTRVPGDNLCYLPQGDLFSEKIGPGEFARHKPAAHHENRQSCSADAIRQISLFS